MMRWCMINNALPNSIYDDDIVADDIISNIEKDDPSTRIQQRGDRTVPFCFPLHPHSCKSFFSIRKRSMTSAIYHHHHQCDNLYCISRAFSIVSFTLLSEGVPYYVTISIVLVQHSLPYHYYLTLWRRTVLLVSIIIIVPFTPWRRQSGEHPRQGRSK